MDNPEIKVLRYNLARVLDLAYVRLKLVSRDARLMTEGKITRTVDNTTFINAFTALLGRLKLLAPDLADKIFEEELCSWEERCKRLNEIQHDASEETRFLLPFAAVRQEAVGHGGFQTGVLGFTRPQFRWVYDCGSWRKKSSLNNRIESFLTRSRADCHLPDVDVLFVSHFDADHVNGLERLFAGCSGVPTTVRMVVAPYLSSPEVIATVGRAAAEGRDSANLIEAVVDPAGYFGAKGVETLVLIRPDEPPPSSEGGGAPTLPTPLSPDRDHRLTLEFFDREGKPIDLNPPAHPKINVIVADPGSFFEMTSYGRSLDWIFLPHAHEWKFNRERVAAECRRVLKLDPDSPGFKAALMEKLRTRMGLKEVKKLYCGMNSNGTSMSLYVGPRTPNSNRIVYAAKAGQPGWLLTGDAPLNRKDAFAQWRRSFSPVAGLAGHLMLPHHGAERNFNSDLISYAPKASLFLTVDRADYIAKKRPPLKVRTALGGQFTAVTETSNLTEVSGPKDGADRAAEAMKW